MSNFIHHQVIEQQEKKILTTLLQNDNSDCNAPMRKCHSFIETKMKMNTAASAAAWRHAHVSPQPPTAILSITLLGADSRDPRDRKCIPTRSVGRRGAAVRRVGPTDRAINVIELAAIGAPLKHASNVRPSCLDLQLIFNCTAPSKYVTDAKSLKPASVELVLRKLSFCCGL